MGSVRGFEYDAVIGVGGIGAEAKAEGISGRINWIGIGPHKKACGKRGPEVTFDHFLDLGTKGPFFRDLAPKLAWCMYSRNVRYTIVSPTDAEHREVHKILAKARHAPASESQAANHRVIQPERCESGCRTCN
jgi:hypothetical protein